MKAKSYHRPGGRRGGIGIAAGGLLAALVTACSNTPTNSGPTGPITFSNSACAIGSGTVSIPAAQAELIDCSNGGTTLTLAGNGASYLILPQFPTDQVSDQLVGYSLATGNLAAATASAERVATLRASTRMEAPGGASRLPPRRVMQRQMAFDGALRARARRASGAQRLSPTPSTLATGLSAAIAPSPQASTRTFHVLSSFDPNTPSWTTVTATLSYAGSNVLVYVDQAAPAGGFTSTQLEAFGQLFDQTLYGIDTLNFGPPSDVDQNGHVIMLMSPVVNADTPSSVCASQGYVAGFFDEEDFNNASDPNSNQGEIFYSIVPDPNGTVSCAHSLSDLGLAVPATFLHELQHLIDFSQHVIINHGLPESSWLDEGLSIVAEELGSLYYEQKCPPPSCRTDPTQLFPDSAEGFVQSFLYDSYQYGLLPDTASLTLHQDSDGGFSWRGGDWAMMRWLGDQLGSGVFRRLEQGPDDGVTDIVSVAGQPFPSLFGNFGLALYTDSLPGLPRGTAPLTDRFVSRNLRLLWDRLYVTYGGGADIPLPFPIQLFPVSFDTSTAVMDPGTMSYFRLDTPSGDSTVAIRFSGPGGAPLPAILHPQLSLFRLPAGQ